VICIGGLVTDVLSKGEPLFVAGATDGHVSRQPRGAKRSRSGHAALSIVLGSSPCAPILESGSTDMRAPDTDCVPLPRVSVGALHAGRCFEDLLEPGGRGTDRVWSPAADGS